MPAARIDVVDSEMDRLIEMLGRRELDIAVGRSSPQYLSAHIQSEELQIERIHFVARVDHPLHGMEGLDWDDLYHYRWVVSNKSAPVRILLNEALQRVGRNIPVDVLQSNSVFASFSLLATSDLLTVASESAIANYERHGALKRLPLPLNILSSVSMYWRREKLRPKAVDLALRCLRELSA
jgi:DNA-binding transcriptional LysR family regulator